MTRAENYAETPTPNHAVDKTSRKAIVEIAGVVKELVLASGRPDLHQRLQKALGELSEAKP